MHFGRLLYVILVIACIEASAQADLKIEDFSVSFSGDPDWTSLSMKVINNGSMPACCNLEVGIYVGKTALLIPSQLLFQLKAGFFLFSTDTFEIDTFFDFCDSTLLAQIPPTYRGGDPLFIGYSVDPHDKIVETDESNNAGVFSQSFQLSCAVGFAELDPSGIHFYYDAVKQHCFFTTRSDAALWDLKIFSLDGRALPAPLSYTGNSILADVSQLHSGMYVATALRKSSGQSATFRFAHVQ